MRRIWPEVIAKPRTRQISIYLVDGNRIDCGILRDVEVVFNADGSPFGIEVETEDRFGAVFYPIHSISRIEETR